MIAPANGHGHIAISGTTFDQFSNCGSIIRDTIQEPTMSEYYTDSEDATNRQRMSQIYFEHDSYSFITPSTACIDTTCASILIDGCYFSNFNHLKPDMTEMNTVSTDSEAMRHYGLILDLKNFYGTVKIKDSTFDQISMKFEN